MGSSVRVIAGDAIRGAVDEDRALEAAERAFRALARGEVVLPPPLGMELAEVAGEVHAKGAWIRGAPVFALKVATGFYRNPERGLPTGSGLFLVFDASTGFPLGVLDDGGYLTELRTGAAGALAVRLLAPPEPDSVAFVGAGVQARYQARALARVARWPTTRVWSQTVDHAEAFAADVEEVLGHRPAPASTVEEAVRDAQVVVTVTPSRTPLVRAAWLRPDATVIAVGSDGPEKVELEPAVLGRADKVVVDLVDQCLVLGELHHAVEAGALGPGEVHAELGQVLVGERPGREGEELIVCDLTGVGVQDAGIAEAAWAALGEGES